MRTVNYSFYSKTYNGALDKAAFACLMLRAAAYVDELTMGRASGELNGDEQQRVQLAVCSVIDAMQVNEERGGVTSASNDGISVSYAAEDSKATGRRLYEAAALFLAPTGLMYRGI